MRRFLLLNLATAVRVLDVGAVLIDLKYESVSFEAYGDLRMHTVTPTFVPLRLSRQSSSCCFPLKRLNP